MKKNVFYLPILIILLIIFLPASIYSLYLHKTYTSESVEEEGVIIFRNSSGEEIGKYECESDYCYEMVSIIDDEYLNSMASSEEKIGIIDDKYVFISDNDIKLINIETNEVVDTFNSVKTYGYDTNLVIVSDEMNQYGLYDVASESYEIEPIYDFMGIVNCGDEFDTSNIVVSLDNKWYIIDQDQTTVSGMFTSPIYDYSSKYVATISDDVYHLYSLYGTEYYTDVQIYNLEFNENYVMIGDENNNVKIYANQQLVAEYQNVNSLRFAKSGNTIELYSNDQLVSSY